MRFRPFLCLFALLVLPAVATAQHEHHMNHGNVEANGDSLAWRMVPMDMSMPMMPGIEDEVPPVTAYLPGQGMDPSMFPAAEPRRVEELADGDTLHLEASLVRRTIDGRDFVMYGYNRQYPGPLIKVDKGSTIIVHFMNNIDLPSTVHWHGLRLDNRFDGVPGLTQAPVESGGTFTYEIYFPDTGIYWYHPHMREDIQQDLGLFGNMLVDPNAEGYYSPANREEVLILDDLLIDAQGIIPYGQEAPTHTLMGRFGNVMLTNGRTNYSLDVQKGEVVRFYLTNVANSRTFNVVFGGAPIKIVASDVSKFEREQWVTSVPIAPAERYVVEVLFEEPGEVAITNSIQAINHFRGEFYPHVDTLGFVNVGAAAVSEDFAEHFTTLRENRDVQADIETYRPHFDRPVDKEIELTLKVENLPLPITLSMEIDTLYVPPMEWNDAMPMMNWLSTGTQVTWILRERDTGRENMDIHWDFRTGDVAKIRIFNNPKTFHPMNHPIHFHGQRFLVLEMDGVPNPNLVWKDTAIVPVGSTMDILVDMSNPGDWMMHCHIAEHLHAGMMMSFHVGDENASR